MMPEGSGSIRKQFEMMIVNNARKTYLDILRIIASVLVVGVHVSAFSIDALEIGSFDFLVANAFDCLSILGVPIFVMISGALELGRGGDTVNAASKEPRISIKSDSHSGADKISKSGSDKGSENYQMDRTGVEPMSVSKSGKNGSYAECSLDTSSTDTGTEIRRSLKKVLYLMLLYFFWLMIYNLLNCYQEGYGFSFTSIRKNVILESLMGRGIYHLWFLPMLAGLSLAAPFLKSFAKDKRLCHYFLLLSFIFTILLPTILKFQYRFPFYAVVEGLYSRIPYVVFTGYTGYFVLGHVLNKWGKEWRFVNRPFPLILLFLISYTIGHLVCFYDSIRWGQLSTILNDPFSATDFIAAGSIFLLVKLVWGGKEIEKGKNLPDAGCQNALLQRLSKATLGVYILHPAVLMIATWAGLNTLFAPQIISIPVCIAIVYLICMGITLVLKMIPGIGRLF